ncbi:MAG: hypothetical protein H0W02_13055 [Ktedonobacteraceae bacterium]|nr:hypothetical protein [Ktedonobacteraceae bacterium]
MWNASTGKHLFTYHGHNGVASAVAWSSDSTRIASGGGDATVQVWQAV